MAEEPREHSTISVRAVLIGAAAIAASVLLSLLAAWGLLRVFGGPPPSIQGQPFTRAAGPTLELTPQQDLQRFRAEERRKLEGYHLIDEQGGVAQLPIERAMALVAADHAEEAKDGAQP